MMTVGEFLKEKREEKGHSLRAVGELARISHTHVKDIETGKREPTFKVLMDLVSALSIDLKEFLKQTGYLPLEAEPKEKTKQVPVLSWTQCGHWREMGEEAYDDYIDTDTSGEFALRVKGDSMEPEFYEGDIVVINPYLKQEHGDFLVVANHEGEATLKQLRKIGSKTRILHPLNPKYDDIELKKEIQYRVIGIVVEKKKRYR